MSDACVTRIVAVMHGDWGGRPLFSKQDWRRGTEYGGVDGLIAPLDSAHDIQDHPIDQLRVIYNTEPASEILVANGVAVVEPMEEIIPTTSKIRDFGS